MSSPEPQPATQPTSLPEAAWGAVIDSSGEEIPITESMIRNACCALDDQPESSAETP